MASAPKYFNNLVSFQKSWGDVTQAYWRKNPNPFSPHIISEDVLERKLVGGKLYTTRLLVKKQGIPALFRHFLTPGLRVCYVKETSVVDPVSQEFEITQENINGTRLMHVVEHIKFRTVARLETVLERKTKITAAIGAIRDAAHSKYSKNIANTDNGIRCVLDGACSAAFLKPIT